jgi:gamma-glutamyltranspeptidase/glutathione hydrolase
MQPQGHLQVVVNLVDYEMNPQAALDAPRWQFVSGNQVLLEQSVPPNVAQELIKRRHEVQIEGGALFGKGGAILRQNGVLVAASEPRADGVALAN